VRLRGLIFMLTGVRDAQSREAITTAWRTRGLLDADGRRAFPLPDAAKPSRRATLAWVLLTLAQDEPTFFACGCLALLTLPVLGLLAALGAMLQRP
jgi:hypothetical protein